MSIDPILLIGGSGVAGRETARLLRSAHPDAPLLIGGRDIAKARETATELGNAEGVELDLSAGDLGLGERPVSVVAVFPKDVMLSALSFAQRHAVPHVNISGGVTEIGPEVATYMHSPSAAPVVLGAEWLVGAATLPTLEYAKEFARVDDITIGALLDERDTGGPETAVDFERLTKTMPAVLARHGGAYVWLDGDDIKSTFRASDDTEVEASAFSPYDVVGLAAATGAPNIRFSLATGVSSTRSRDEQMSTEIVVELSGEDQDGQPLSTRHAVAHPQGAMTLTGIGIATVLERLVGLDGNPPVPSGLYFPHQLLEPTVYLARLEQAGGALVKLES